MLTYKAIALGPFRGLFALHMAGDISAMSQQEVAEKIQHAESVFGLDPGKRYFYLQVGHILPEQAVMYQSLIGLLQHYGYFVILEMDGTEFYSFASIANHISVLSRDVKTWIRHPCHSFVLLGVPGQDPRFEGNQATTKYIAVDAIDASVLQFLRASKFPWVVQPPSTIKEEIVL